MSWTPTANFRLVRAVDGDVCLYMGVKMQDGDADRFVDMARVKLQQQFTSNREWGMHEWRDIPLVEEGGE